MLLKKTFFLRCLVVLIALMGTAYASVASDITRQATMDRVVRGTFKQSQYLLNVNKPFESSGNFIFWRNKAMLWRTLEPIRTKTVYNNQELSVYLYINGERIEQQANATTSLINRLLWNLMTGNLDVLSLDFQVLSKFDSTGWEFVLYPNSSVTNLLINRMTVRGNSFAEEITVEHFSGDITLLELENVTYSDKSTSLEEAELDKP